MMNRTFHTTPAVIALQRGLFYLDSRTAEVMTAPAPALAYTVQAELMRLGYMLDERAFSCLTTLPQEDVIRWYNEVTAYLIYIKGDGNYTPLYTGFPQQVMELSDVELFWNAVRHYWSNGEWVPNAYTKAKPTAFEHTEYRMLRPCSEAEFNRIFTDILSVNQSITPMDKEVVKWFLENREMQWLVENTPKEIPFKENLCFVLSLGADFIPNFTYTDILRTATYMSGGDISLAENTRFRLTGRQRSHIMSLLERKVGCCEKTGQAFLDSLEDLKKHRGKWLALFNHIHADSKRYRKPKYENAQRVVEILRFHEKNIKTWNAKVQDTHFDVVMKQMMQRPGEFARRLNDLLQSPWEVNFPDNKILHCFGEVSDKISNKVLFELYTYFEGRRKAQTQRTVFIKGARRPVKLEPLPTLPKEIVDKVQNVILEAVKGKFTAWPSMGKVLIDERLKNIPLPTNMRSVSETDTPIVRGTRMPIRADRTKTVRFYVHWQDKEGTEDLDLSATLLGMGVKCHVSWNTNYKLEMRNHRTGQATGKYVAVHSGDVRHRKGSCAEYIDIDIRNASLCGIRYALVDVRNFNDRSMKSVNPAFGYMEREHPEANDTWVPATVTASWRLQSEANACLAVLIDLEKMEYIPLDIDSNSITATGDMENILTALRMYMEPPRLSVFDLVSWHVSAREGEVVTELPEGEDAESVQQFRFEDYSTSYIETLKLMADTPPETTT